MQVNLSLYGLI